MGQMDIETGVKYANSIKPYLSELGSDWATMIDLNDWGLHIPEVSDLMEKFHELVTPQWASSRGVYYGK